MSTNTTIEPADEYLKRMKAEKAQANAGDRERYKLRGRPLAAYVGKTINHEDTILGDRWLCRGGGAFVVAPSGMGKSVFSVQVSINWSIGKREFGIRPARPLKVLIIQA